MGKSVQTYQIHAYIDGQLSRDECFEIEEAMQFDSELQDEICHLRALKSQVKSAYADIPVPERDRKPVSKRVWSIPKTAAASLFLGVVMGAGMLSLFSGQNGGVSQQPLAMAQADQQKYIVHLDSDDLKKQAEALDEIETLLKDGGPNVKVDFISNYKGIKMFDVNNPNHDQLEKLLGQYDNLTLYACKRALERAMQRGEKVNVIPQVRHDKPAIDAVVERLNEGWKYIKI
ncbi:hypothetical protein QCB45_07700 [Thiomicrorhabdus sp. ZW0627]|uniref:hypothetical protein n=1 Tax=Thiomicrorhabdus sp. ZW0627 TaxID=3039774 RepID=UPI0024368040|nr:hypothetical protein [Thiomicrorhabdus sp. ZW0627]MDG6774213.1 hypothetical protein [Thiomicrorhabdus sp. ZW0627]